MTQYIKIKTTGIGYVPDPPITKPGSEVTFEMDGRTDQVDVYFGTNSPFVSQATLIHLNGAVQAQASKTFYIAEFADGHYPFSVTPTVNTDPEPPTSTPGDLEVSREGPPKDEEKK
jgi:hypothetical protein